MQKVINLLPITIAIALFIGCKGTKLIAKKNSIYAYVDNEKARHDGHSHDGHIVDDSLVTYHVLKPFKAKLIPKINEDFEWYYLGLTKQQLDSLVLINKINAKIEFKHTDTKNLGFDGKPYYPV
jgi:hypothetical protein